MTAPSLSVEVQPPVAFARDSIAQPYDTFTLKCTATASDGVIVAKSFEWSRGPPGAQTVVGHNGNTISIRNYDLWSPQSISLLTVTGEPVGSYLYNCTVRMSVPGGLDHVASAVANVEITGKLVSTHPKLFNRSHSCFTNGQTKAVTVAIYTFQSVECISQVLVF